MRLSSRMSSWTNHNFYDKWECWQMHNVFYRSNAENCAVTLPWISSCDLLTGLMSISSWQIKTKALNNYNYLKSWQINCWQIKCFLMPRLKCFSKPMFPSTCLLVPFSLLWGYNLIISILFNKYIFNYLTCLT